MRTTINRWAMKALNTLFPSNKPTLFVGPKAQRQVANLMVENNYQNIILIADGFLTQSGKLTPIIDTFEQNKINTTVFDQVKPNPTLDLVDNCIQLAKQNQCEAVLVIGGGSAIDIAKVVAASITNGFNAEKLIGIVKVKHASAPLYAVPTTSGTGSEATTAAVISDPISHKKQFFVDPKLVPVVAGLDPELIASLPAPITAATGMDALTHAIEAFTSTAQFDYAREQALTAIKLLVKYLPLAYEDGEDLASREQVALASFLAGVAFSQSGLGFVHAISHQISAHYNTAHGLANAVLLPQVMRYNQVVSEADFAEIEMAVNPRAAVRDNKILAQNLITRIDDLAAKLAIPKTLKEIKASDFDAITSAALKEARSSYAVPKFMKPKDIHQILNAVSQR